MSFPYPPPGDAPGLLCGLSTREDSPGSQAKSEQNVRQDLIPRVRHHGEAALCTPLSFALKRHRYLVSTLINTVDTDEDDIAVVVSESGEEKEQSTHLQGYSLQTSDAQLAIKKQRAAIQRKALRETAKQVTLGVLKLKFQLELQKILKQHPDIGKDIGEFVRSKQIGTHAWMRTGFLTFDGSRVWWVWRWPFFL